MAAGTDLDWLEVKIQNLKQNLDNQQSLNLEVEKVVEARLREVID